jgi:hypothetical protein
VGDLSLAAVEEVRGWQGGPTATGSAVGRGGAGPEGVESTRHGGARGEAGEGGGTTESTEADA